MQILYLDQNKWIELARVHVGRESRKELVNLYDELGTAVDRGALLIPISKAHVIETSKINSPERREHLAATFRELNRGVILRSRAGRLAVELLSTLNELFGKPPLNLPMRWALGANFLQAFEQFDELIAHQSARELLQNMDSVMSPADCLYDFLVNGDDDDRRKGIAGFTAGSDELVSRIEERRTAMTNVSREMRRRAYMARLFLDHQDIILDHLQFLGESRGSLEALGNAAFTAIIENTPTLAVETALAMKVEIQSRAIARNDLLDLHSLCAAIPYCDFVVAEKTFINLANQCKLGQRYNAKLITRLTDLPSHLADAAPA